MSENEHLEQQPKMFDIPEEKFEPNLRDRYIVPPFSVLNTQIGDWQSRKRNWISLGIKSELGRGAGVWVESETGSPLDGQAGYKCPARCFGQDIMKGENKNFRYQADSISNLTNAPTRPDCPIGTGTANMAPGTSIFDPVLCELMYKWFCPDNGQILDPFAGGSVRGIVAGILDYEYIGIDLAKQQLEANEEQRKAIIPDKNVMWLHGDSYQVLDTIPDNCFDFVFSCPPYFNLEVYSKDPSDLSVMTWDGFKDAYRGIIAKTVSKLKINRFACFVVGNVRDRQGFYYDLCGETIQAFESAGAKYYNEIILVNSCGSLPIRITKQFEAGRKIGKMHQNVLVFYKGDPKAIKTNL